MRFLKLQLPEEKSGEVYLAKGCRAIGKGLKARFKSAINIFDAQTNSPAARN